MTLNGHFDGKSIVLDEPVPAGVTPNTPVKVVFTTNGDGGSLTDLSDLAHPGGLPPDFAQQHDHYVHGLPKR